MNFLLIFDVDLIKLFHRVVRRIAILIDDTESSKLFFTLFLSVSLV